MPRIGETGQNLQKTGKNWKPKANMVLPPVWFLKKHAFTGYSPIYALLRKITVYVEILGNFKLLIFTCYIFCFLQYFRSWALPLGTVVDANLTNASLICSSIALQWIFFEFWITKCLVQLYLCCNEFCVDKICLHPYYQVTHVTYGVILSNILSFNIFIFDPYFDK